MTLDFCAGVERHISVFVSKLSGGSLRSQPFRLLAGESIFDLKWLIRDEKKRFGLPSEMQLVHNTDVLPDDWTFNQAATNTLHLTLVTRHHGCATCGVQHQPLNRCANCKNASYCSHHCQRRHWVAHREQCRQSFRPIPTTVEVVCPNGCLMGVEAPMSMTVRKLKHEVVDAALVDRCLVKQLVVVAPGHKFLMSEMRLAEVDGFHAGRPLRLRTFLRSTPQVAALLDVHRICLSACSGTFVRTLTVVGLGGAMRPEETTALSRRHRFWVTRRKGSVRAHSAPP